MTTRPRTHSGTWSAKAWYSGHYCETDAMVSVPVSIGKFFPQVARSSPHWRTSLVSKSFYQKVALVGRTDHARVHSSQCGLTDVLVLASVQMRWQFRRY